VGLSVHASSLVRSPHLILHLFFLKVELNLIILRSVRSVRDIVRRAIDLRNTASNVQL
jgi:hypothetical protein